MAPARFAFALFFGTFFVVAGFVHGFRLRDLPPKAPESEKLLSKVSPRESKCDTCNSGELGEAPKKPLPMSVAKVKQTVDAGHKLFSNDKPVARPVVANKHEVFAKKPVVQAKKPSLSLKVTKNDSDDDDDDADDDDDSDDDKDSDYGSDDSQTDTSDDDDDDDDEDDDDDDDDSTNDDSTDSDEDDDDDDSDTNDSGKDSDTDDKTDDDSDDDEDDDDDDSDETSDDSSSDTDDKTTDGDSSDDKTDDDSDDDESDSDTQSNDDSDDSDSETDIKIKITSVIKPKSENLQIVKPKENPPQKSKIPHIKISVKEPPKIMKTETEKLKIPAHEIKDSKKDIKHDITKVPIKKDIVQPPKPKVEKPKPVEAVKPPEVKKIEKATTDKVHRDSSTQTKPATAKPTIEKSHTPEAPKKDSKTHEQPVKKAEIKTVEKHNDEKKPEKVLKPEVKKVQPEAVKPVQTKHLDPPKVTPKELHKPAEKPIKKEFGNEKKEEPKHTPNIDKHTEKVKPVKVEIKSKKVIPPTRSHGAAQRKNLRESEFEDYYTFFPTFAPNFSRIHHPECRRHGQILLRQLRGAKLWTLQILDSTAKIPSGILRGNGNQLGDFDQCVGTRARIRLDSGSVVKVSGKYCLAQIDLKPTKEELKLPVHLAQARNFIRSKHDDPGHFIPRFTSLNWGICLPAACGAPEAEFIMRDALRHYNGTAGMRLVINVDPVNCYTDDIKQDWWEEWLDIPTLCTVILFGTIISITLYATLKDIVSSSRRLSNKVEEATDESNENAEKEEPAEEVEENKENAEEEEKAAPSKSRPQTSMIQAFSLKQTMSKLLREGSAEGEIECIHGIRALCSVALYIAHKLIPLAMTPFTNRTYLTEMSNSRLSVALRASLLYTDTFLLLSGVLSAFHMSLDIDKKGSIPWMRRYIARYIRLTPALVVVLLWYAWISDKIGDGPLWGTVVTQNAELCQQHMWKNIFYIQNFFPFEEMCATHTHQLALDMQLWWLAPFIVWLLRSKPALALPALGALHVFSIWLRYSVTASDHLSLIIYHGITVSQLYRTANMCYSLALHRATPYLAGIGLGVLLQQTGKNISVPKLMFIPGWIICGYFGSWALYTPAHLSMRDYQYDVNEASQYAALASVAWALCLSWIIFVCFTGNGGPINDLLCCQPLVFLSRISYSMYLCQFLVFFYNVGSMRTSNEFSFANGVSLFEILTVVGVSIILTLLFDIPMQSMKNVIMSINIDFGIKKANDETAETEVTQEYLENEDETIAQEPVEEEPVEEEEIEVEEEVYEYENDENDESVHHDVEQDIIYEEEEDEIEIEPEVFEGGEISENKRDGELDDDNDGEKAEEEDLQGWELTSGENNYYYHR